MKCLVPIPNELAESLKKAKGGVHPAAWREENGETQSV
jgi:hypothetical protein